MKSVIFEFDPVETLYAPYCLPDVDMLHRVDVGAYVYLSQNLSFLYNELAKDGWKNFDSLVPYFNDAIRQWARDNNRYCVQCNVWLFSIVWSGVQRVPQLEKRFSGDEEEGDEEEGDEERRFRIIHKSFRHVENMGLEVATSEEEKGVQMEEMVNFLERQERMWVEHISKGMNAITDRIQRVVKNNQDDPVLQESARELTTYQQRVWKFHPSMQTPEEPGVWPSERRLAMAEWLPPLVHALPKLDAYVTALEQQVQQHGLGLPVTPKELQLKRAGSNDSVCSAVSPPPMP